MPASFRSARSTPNSSRKARVWLATYHAVIGGGAVIERQAKNSWGAPSG